MIFVVTLVVTPVVFRCVLVVTDVLVSFSLVGVLGAGSSLGSECEIVEPQSFSFSKKRQAFLIESQGGMSMEDSLEEVPPFTRRKVQEVDCWIGHGRAAVSKQSQRGCCITWTTQQ